MKRILALACSAIAALCAHAQTAGTTVTPNIGLQVPYYGQSNWQVPLNYSLNRLDCLLSGNCSLPGLLMSGAITLAADPTQPLQAATKQYVDNNIGGGAGNATQINGVTLSTLGAGFYKFNAQGVPSLAVAGTDYLSSAQVAAAIASGTAAKALSSTQQGTQCNAGYAPTGVDVNWNSLNCTAIGTGGSSNATQINGVTLSTLGAGFYKFSSQGVPSLAVSGTDYLSSTQVAAAISAGTAAKAIAAATIGTACPTGQAATGVDANWNALGCAPIGQAYSSITQTNNNVSIAGTTALNDGSGVSGAWLFQVGTAPSTPASGFGGIGVSDLQTSPVLLIVPPAPGSGFSKITATGGVLRMATPQALLAADMAGLWSGTFTTGDCLKIVVTGGVNYLADAGAACGSGTGGSSTYTTVTTADTVGANKGTVSYSGGVTTVQSYGSSNSVCGNLDLVGSTADGSTTVNYFMQAICGGTVTINNVTQAPRFVATGSSINGSFQMTSVGTLPPVPGSNLVGWTAPAAVTTPYLGVMPPAPPTAAGQYLSCTNATTPICSWATPAGGSSNLATNNSWTGSNAYLVPTVTFTTLSAAVTTSATTIPVASTTGYPTSGYAVMGASGYAGDTEIFGYTGVTSTSFTGVTRGLFSTSAQAVSSGSQVYPISMVMAESTAVAPSMMKIAGGGTFFFGNDTSNDLASVLNNISGPGNAQNFFNHLQAYNYLSIGSASLTNDFNGGYTTPSGHVYSSGLQTGLNSVYLTTAKSITSTTAVTTGLVFPSIPASTTIHGRCSLIYEQATAAAAVTFSVAASAAPTNLWAMNSIYNGTATAQQYTAITSTTNTAITASTVPAAAATPYREEVDFTLVTGSNAVVLTLYGLTSTAADALVIEPGSTCGWTL